MVSDATVLGKRKRVKQQQPSSKAKADKSEAVDKAALEDAQAIFRRHFEAQFVPLQETEGNASGGKKGKKTARAEPDSDDDGHASVEDLRSDSEDEEDDDDNDEEDDDDDEGDWDGLSGEDEGDSDDDSSEAENQVEVVDHSKPLNTSSDVTRQALMGMTKREMRAYLSSRPPDAQSEAEKAKARQQLLKKQKQGADGEDGDDAQNEDSKALLAKDLELQRLISESHILSAHNPFNTTTSGAAKQAFASGRTRALTTDLRLQGLGSKGSIFSQQKMPMGMRKGITGAKAAREEKRRREARENGIILERPTEEASKKKKSGGAKGRRGLAVDMPGMGRMKNGELRLSKREVKAVEMEGKRFDTGKRRRRRR